jgi:hypothetical protein
MKKEKNYYLCVIAFLMLLLTAQKSYSQSYSDGLVFNIGVVQDGIGGLFNYNYFVDRHDFIEGGLLITMAKYKYKEGIDIPYSDFTFNIGYSKNIYYNYENTFNINIGGGGVFGYETINNGNKILSNGAVIGSDSAFIYGGYVSLDLDYSITDQTSLALKMNQYYHINSSMGKLMPFVGIGLRYYVN